MTQRSYSKKNFCPIPWIHLYARADGIVGPCCQIPYGTLNLPNINETTILDALNSEVSRNLRQSFMDGEMPALCGRCKRSEDSGSMSPRIGYVKRFSNDRMRDMVDNHTLPDGTITKVDIQFLDVRFRNLCNLKCRMCDTSNSSTWFEEENEHRASEDRPLNTTKFINLDILDDLMPMLDSVEEIYFAGGEPTIFPEHYAILEQLVALERTHVRLRYNTNLTTLKYKNYDLLELWSKFDNVMIGASIDGMGTVGELQRTGLDWKEFESNYNTVRHANPSFIMYPAISITALNIDHLEEFLTYCFDNNWFDRPLMPSIVEHPGWISIAILPDDYKLSLAERYDKFANTSPEMHQNGIRAIANRLRSAVGEEDVNRLVNCMDKYVPDWKKLKHLTFLHT